MMFQSLAKNDLLDGKERNFSFHRTEDNLQFCSIKNNESEIIISTICEREKIKCFDAKDKISAAMLFRNSIIISTIKDNVVKMMNGQDFSFQNILCSFSLPVIVLVTNPSETIVFAASEDGSIKGYNVEDDELIIFDIQFDSPIKNIEASENYLAVSLESGKITVLNIAERCVSFEMNENLIGHDLKSILKPCFFNFSIDKLLALPSNECVKIINEDSKSTDKPIKQFKIKSTGSQVVQVKVFDNFKYLIASNSIGEVYVWSYGTEFLIGMKNFGFQIDDIIVDSVDKKVFVIGSEGRVNYVTFSEIAANALTMKMHDSSSEELSLNGKYLDDDADNDLETSETLEQKFPKKVSSAFVLSPVKNMPKKSKLKSLSSDDEKENRHITEKDLDARFRDKKKKRKYSEDEEESLVEDEYDIIGSNYSGMENGMPMGPGLLQIQRVTMPNSTSFLINSQTKAFLDFNIHGCIEISRSAIDQTKEKNVSDEETSILARFHDTSYHHNVHIENKENYFIGRINKKALVLVGKSETENTVHCRIFDTWTNYKIWNYKFPIDENVGGISCFAMSDNHIFFVTNDQLLHIFNYGGHEIDTICTKYPVISIITSSNSRNVNSDFLCLVYSNLEVDIYTYEKWNLALKSSTRCPMKTQLKWVTFSKENLLACSDASGRIQMFNPTSNCWYPIFKSVDLETFFWPITIVKQNIYGVRCDRETIQPEVHPSPIIVKEAFNQNCMLPGGGYSAPELLQQAWVDRTATSLMSAANLPSKKLEQKMLANLVKVYDSEAGNNAFHAFETAKLLPTVDAMKICMRYAQKKQFTILAKQLGEHIDRIENEIEKSKVNE